MKAKSYKLKYTPTEEQLIKELSARSGGCCIANILKHGYAKMKTIMTIGFAQTENESR